MVKPWGQCLHIILMEQIQLFGVDFLLTNHFFKQDAAQRHFNRISAILGHPG